MLVGETQTTDTISESTRWDEGISTPMHECSYFTGRNFQVTQVEASEIDECPALFKPYPDAGL